MQARRRGEGGRKVTKEKYVQFVNNVPYILLITERLNKRDRIHIRGQIHAKSF